MKTELIIKVADYPELVTAKEQLENLVKENPFVEIKDTKTYELAKKRRTNLVKGRTEIQKGEKAIASKLNAFRKDVKALAENLVGITLPAETKQQNEVKRYEEIKQKEKEEKERLRKIQMEEWLNKSQSILKYIEMISVADDTKITGLQLEIQQIEITEEEYGAYQLIAAQNLNTVKNMLETKLAQLKEDAERKKQEALEAEKKRLEREAEKKRIKAEELEKARQAYREYFGEEGILGDTATTEDIYAIIEDDKKAKLNKLAEMEAKQIERLKAANSLLEEAKRQDEEKLKAAHHLINLFPDMTLPEAMELSLEDINKRINNRIAEIESGMKAVKAEPVVLRTAEIKPGMKFNILDEETQMMMIHDVEIIIDGLRGIKGSLPAIQKLKEAVEIIKSLKS